jgi:hypothetical protein
VKADANDPERAFFCNLPLMQISDEYRKQAIFIARDPARIAIVVTSHVHSQRMFFFPSLATHQ